MQQCPLKRSFIQGVCQNGILSGNGHNLSSLSRRGSLQILLSLEIFDNLFIPDTITNGLGLNVHYGLIRKVIIDILLIHIG